MAKDVSIRRIMLAKYNQSHKPHDSRFEISIIYKWNRNPMRHLKPVTDVFHRYTT